MPLTAAEKNQIAQLSQLAATETIVAEAGLGLVGAAGIGLVFLPIALGISAALNRVRFPQLSTGDIARTARAAGEGFAISSDPFFGDVVISRPEQADFLTELVRNSALRRITAEQDTSRLFLERRGLIEGLAESAQDRGFAAAIDPNLRGGVFRPSADQPLQFIEGEF